MSEHLRRAVVAVCDRPDAPSDEVGRRAFDHLKEQVEAVLDAIERDGTVFGRICPSSERGDMAAVVASVLVRAAAERSAVHAFAPCPRCGNHAPTTSADETEATG
mgnify:CR=1 FL=1